MHQSEILIVAMQDARAEAKRLYKAWKVTPDDSRLMDAYSKAWQAYQQADMAQFLYETENE